MLIVMRCLFLFTACALFSIQTGCTARGPAISDAESCEKNTFDLLNAALASQAAGKTEDAAFLFLAGQVRFQIDRHVYPPTESGSESPEARKTVYGLTVGAMVMPALKKDPAMKSSVHSRLAKWSATFPQGYDPGWRYRKPLDEKESLAYAAEQLRAFLVPLESAAALSKRVDYRKAELDYREASAGIERILKAKPKGALSAGLQGAALEEYKAAVSKSTVAKEEMRLITWREVPSSRWHARMGWKADDFFTAPPVLELCHAIEVDDVAEMERLITAGADVNAIGKDGMTPLLWAFPDRMVSRFECLLKHGANPNTIIASDFGARQQSFHRAKVEGSYISDIGCHAGEAVMHLAARSPCIEYLELVVAHDGDVNLVDQKTGDTPLHLVLERSMPDMQKRVELLLVNKAAPNRYSAWRKAYPTMQAVAISRFEVALVLLEAGADPSLYQPDGERKLAHEVVRARRNLPHFRPEQLKAFENLERWLEAHGESLQEAEADEARWNERYQKASNTSDRNKIREQIIAERLSQEGK